MIQTVSLGDIGRVVTGKTPPKANPEFWGDEIDFVTPTDFKDDSRYVKTARKLSHTGMACMKKLICPKNSVMVTCIGSDMGKAALSNKPFVTNQQINSLIVNNNHIDAAFVYYLLKMHRPLLKKYAESGGSTMPIINKSTFEKLQFAIPDLSAQKRIAKILSDIDEKIELNRRMNETLEQMGQALFKHYFIDNPGAKTWGKILLGDKIKPRRGKSLTSKKMVIGEALVISGGLQPAGRHNESNTIAPVVTISASGANAGFVALWGENIWSADSSYIDTTVTNNVYFYYIFLKINQDRIFGMQTGSGQPHIYPSHLELLELPNAPVELIDEFNDRMSPIFAKIKQNKQATEILTSLRDHLLPRLISGKIRV
jgi:restriction endonuclease S subunit